MGDAVVMLLNERYRVVTRRYEEMPDVEIDFESISIGPLLAPSGSSPGVANSFASLVFECPWNAT